MFCFLFCFFSKRSTQSEIQWLLFPSRSFDDWLTGKIPRLVNVWQKQVPRCLGFFFSSLSSFSLQLLGSQNAAVWGSRHLHCRPHAICFCQTMSLFSHIYTNMTLPMSYSKGMNSVWLINQLIIKFVMINIHMGHDSYTFSSKSNTKENFGTNSWKNKNKTENNKTNSWKDGQTF